MGNGSKLWAPPEPGSARGLFWWRGPAGARTRGGGGPRSSRVRGYSVRGFGACGLGARGEMGTVQGAEPWTDCWACRARCAVATQWQQHRTRRSVKWGRCAWAGSRPQRVAARLHVRPRRDAATALAGQLEGEGSRRSGRMDGMEVVPLRSPVAPPVRCVCVGMGPAGSALRSCRAEEGRPCRRLCACVRVQG